MTREIRALMSVSPEHWTKQAICTGDARFTGRREWLSNSDDVDMASICERCPVIDQCRNWADESDVVSVFAAGSWRYSDDERNFQSP